MISFVSFSQDIDFSKMKNEEKIKKNKINNSPLEFSMSYGITYNLSDSINDKQTNIFNYTDTTIYNSFIIDSIGFINNSFNVGLRKRFNKIRLGVNFNYLTSSHSNQDFLKDTIFLFQGSQGSNEYDFINSKTEFKMNSYRLNFQLDYLFFEKKNTNMYLCIGLGYSSTILNDNLKFQRKRTGINNIGDTTISYYGFDMMTKFSNNTIFILPSFGLEHKFTSRIKANINFSLYMPFSSSLNRGGTIKLYSAGQPFNDNWQVNDELNNSDYFYDFNTGNVEEEIRRHSYSFKNPLQIGVNLGIIYSLK